MPKSRRFIDRVTIDALAGNGGNGVATFRREKFIPRGGPSGGDGGKGGDVLLEADGNVDSLVALYYQPLQKAGHGGHGMNRDRHGRNGTDRILRVPPGTTVQEAESGQPAGEVVHPGERLGLARGGRGGLGNLHFKTSTHQAPRECTPGTPGEQKRLILELKLVADIGLVGYPNAGKSSLLRRLSAARPKVADYPFTTLNPMLGTLADEEDEPLRIADIPGLIEGAHSGRGLGHTFLRHIERTRVLVFVMDMAASEGRDPSADYHGLREELRCYRAGLDEKPYLVLANKMDLPAAAQHLRDFRLNTGEAPLEISALTGLGLEALPSLLRRLVRRTRTSAPA